jgi:hypothetical protein
MKNVNELVNETLFDININDNIEDYKIKMKNIIHQVNILIQNTDFEITLTEMNSEVNCDTVFVTLVSKLSKDINN